MDAWGPHGYFISNGPGDPSVMDYAIRTVRNILDADKPLFGICLGHQLLALACGISTYKMHHGHRGLNHPVKNLQSGLGEMTSQNHGFAVSEKDIEKNPTSRSPISISTMQRSWAFGSKPARPFLFNTTRRRRRAPTTRAICSTNLSK